MFHGVPAAVASAPGRVNLIGEHTDYNGGFVLPMAIPQRTWAAVAQARDRRAHASSRNLGGGERIREFTVGAEAPTKSWVDYVQGLTQALARDGHAIGGFDLAIVSNVPLGSGLSSSAALEVAVLRALRELFGLSLDDVRLAQLGQRAENDFVGAPVGLMDQMAASLADDHTALFLDTRTLGFEQVPLPPGGELVVINSGVAHNHASGDYRTRRAECERAAAALGVPQLRDLGPAASHASQRDDFEVSVPEIDLLVDLASAETGVFGARLTGGGFGGSIVALAEEGAAHTIGERVSRAYAARSGHTATVLVPQTI